MSKMQKLLPENIQKALDDWFDGYAFEIIHFWNYDGAYQIVVVSTDNHVVCVRIWESIFNGSVNVSVDKDFDLEEGQ